MTWVCACWLQLDQMCLATLKPTLLLRNRRQGCVYVQLTPTLATYASAGLLVSAVMTNPDDRRATFSVLCDLDQAFG